MLCRPAKAEAKGAAVCGDDVAVKRFPTLIEYLGQDTWEDGSAREVSTVLCVMEGGLFKACLIDKEGDRTLWVTTSTLGKLWEALEAAVSADRPDWRRRREAPRRR